VFKITWKHLVKPIEVTTQLNLICSALICLDIETHRKILLKYTNLYEKKSYVILFVSSHNFFISRCFEIKNPEQTKKAITQLFTYSSKPLL
jgi:hypothetical protein